MNVFEVTYMFLAGSERLEATETVETEFELQEYSLDLEQTLTKFPRIVIEPVGENIILKTDNIYATSIKPKSE